MSKCRSHKKADPAYQVNSVGFLGDLWKQLLALAVIPLAFCFKELDVGS
jgi:hypothetical protein